jgi:hypothetical protein
MYAIYHLPYHKRKTFSFESRKKENAIAGYSALPLNAGPLQADHTFIAVKAGMLCNPQWPL